MAFRREAVIKSAEKYVARGKIEAAIREYRKVLEDNPTDTSTLNRVGDLYARIERFDEAVRLFTQIAEHYTSDGFFVKAIAIYKKIIKLDPTVLRVYEKLAALYAKQGLITEARTQYQVLADYYQKHDNVASAITIYQRMAELEPDNPSFRLKLADLYTSRSLTDKAMQELRSLAEIFVVSGSLDEAAQVFVRALDTNPDDLDFVEKAVHLLQQQGSTDGAERVLARALERNPKAADIGRRLGIALPGAEVVTPEAAVPEVEEAVEEVPIETDDLPPLDEVALEVLDNALIEGDLGLGLGESSPPDMGVMESVDAPVGGQASDVFHFDLDLDDDDAPSSLVQPPPDMLEAAFSDATEAFGEASTPPAPAGEAFELVIGDLDEKGSFEEEIGEVGAADEIAEAATPVGLEEDVPIEIEIDWEFDGVEEVGIDRATGLATETEPGAEAELPDVLALEQPDTLPPATEVQGVAAEEDIRPEDDLPDGAGQDVEEIEFTVPSLDFEESDFEVAAPVEVAPEELVDALPELDLGATIATVPAPTERAPKADLPEAKPLDLEATLPTTSVSPTVAPETVAPETVAPETVAPETVAPETVAPETVAPETVAPETVAPETVAPETVAPVTPPAVSAIHRQDDLFAEALVFAKYGLRQKAEERLNELHERNPEHLGGWLLVTRMHLEAGQTAEVVNHANRVAMLARQTGEPEVWDQLREELVYAGYPLDGAVVVGEPSEEEGTRESRISQFLEMLDTPAASEPLAPPTTPPTEVEPLAAAPEEAAAPAPVVPEIQPAMPDVVASSGLELDIDVDLAVVGLVEATAPLVGRKVNLVEELGLDEGELPAPPVPPVPPVPPAPHAPSGAFDDSGMSWLDDAHVPMAEPEPTETIFDEEDDFFDLAAELERELSEDEIADGTASVSQAEGQSLEEIVEGFKKGVAENLSPEDYDTHFNLGIAYREMGLLDEAIGEFQLASKDARYLVESSSMLGICFLDKGLPELAIKWYRKGLASPAIREDETLGLLYEMGGVYSKVGDKEAARKTFVEIYGMDSGYRDVTDRLKSLEAS